MMIVGQGRGRTNLAGSGRGRLRGAETLGGLASGDGGGQREEERGRERGGSKQRARQEAVLGSELG